MLYYEKGDRIKIKESEDTRALKIAGRYGRVTRAGGGAHVQVRLDGDEYDWAMRQESMIFVWNPPKKKGKKKHGVRN